MKARVSPLELHSYFVTEVSCTANPKYDPAKPPQLELEDLQVETRACPPKTNGNDEQDMWRLLLTLRQNVSPEKNAPYNFFILMQGWFSVQAGAFVPEQTPQLVETTGSSILYGVAREMLRSIMATGPYLPLILPSVSFHPAAPAIPEKEVVKTKESPPKKIKPRIAKK